MSLAGSVVGSLLAIEASTTLGCGSQRSRALTTKETGRRLPSGGQRLSGTALTEIAGAAVSRTVTTTVSVVTAPAASRPPRSIVQVPGDSVTVGVGPLAVPNGPVQVYSSAPFSGSDEARASSVTAAPSGPVHSIVRSGPASRSEERRVGN